MLFFAPNIVPVVEFGLKCGKFQVLVLGRHKALLVVVRILAVRLELS